jgi:hypothetical protein
LRRPAQKLGTDEGAGGKEHRVVRARICQRIILVVQCHQGIKLLGFSFGYFNGEERHHLTRAFAHTDVADGVGARIAPIAERQWVLFVNRQDHERLDQVAHTFLAAPCDPLLEALSDATFLDIGVGQYIQ